MSFTTSTLYLSLSLLQLWIPLKKQVSPPKSPFESSPPPLLTYQCRTPKTSPILQGESSDSCLSPLTSLPCFLMMMILVGQLRSGKVFIQPIVLNLTIIQSYHQSSPSYFSFASSLYSFTIPRNAT